MSTTAPGWKVAIDKALQKDKTQTVYQLATTDSSAPETPATPHVRSHIHRAFFEPVSPARPLLVTTTDIRTPKARQIAQNSRVEVAWWIASSKAQFRISGRAYAFPAPNVSRNAVTGTNEGTITSGDTAGVEVTAMKLMDDFKAAKLGADDFDWESKRQEMFDSMSSHMKASWVRPVPGSPLPGGYGTAKEWPTTLPKQGEAESEEDKRNVEEGLRNFALLVIDPSEVDYVNMDVVPNERTIFRREMPNGYTWMETIVVP